MKLSRRRFLQLSATAGASFAIGARSAHAMELKFGGADASGGREGGASGSSILRTSVPSVCGLCDAGCGILGFLAGNRLAKIEGNPKHPNNLGSICARGFAGIQHLYDPFRIRGPMQRIGGWRGEPIASQRWKRISWEEALKILVERLGRIHDTAPDEFVYHRGRTKMEPFLRRFTNAFGTPHLLSADSVGYGGGWVANELTFGAEEPVPDAARSRYILLFGTNIYESHPHHISLVKRVVDARLKGAKMVVFDPRLSKTAGRSDEWVPLLPGTDGAVALAMAQVILTEGLADTAFLDAWTNVPAAKLRNYLASYTPEWAAKISDVPADRIRRLAREFATNKPGFALAHRGALMHPNGTQAVRAVVLLNAVAGQIDMPGGFCLPRSKSIRDLEPAPPLPSAPAWLQDSATYPMASYGTDHLLARRLQESGRKIGLYWIHEHNPAFSFPDSKQFQNVMADERLIEFIVDTSPYWSETSAFAELILPDCTYLERYSLDASPGFDHVPFIALRQPIVQPQHRSRSTYDVLIDISHRLGGTMTDYFPYASTEEWCRQVVETQWGTDAWETLKSDGVLLPSGVQWDDEAQAWTGGKVILPAFKNPITNSELSELTSMGASMPNGDGPMLDSVGKSALALIRKGIAYRGFPTRSGLLEISSTVVAESGTGSDPLPAFQSTPALERLKPGNFLLVSFKESPHARGRSAGSWWLAEASHYNPVWINEEVAKAMGIGEGDWIAIRTDQGKIELRAHVTQGIHPRVVAVAEGMGHWEHGALAQAGLFYGEQSPSVLRPQDAQQHEELEEMWYIRAEWPVDVRVRNGKGRPAIGWSVNSLFTANNESTDPLGGSFAWYSTPCRISVSRKV